MLGFVRYSKARRLGVRRDTGPFQRYRWQRNQICTRLNATPACAYVVRVPIPRYAGNTRVACRYTRRYACSRDNFADAGLPDINFHHFNHFRHHRLQKFLLAVPFYFILRPLRRVPCHANGQAVSRRLKQSNQGSFRFYRARISQKFHERVLRFSECGVRNLRLSVIT